MSKSLLICVLETVPKTSRLIPSHISLYILVANAAAFNEAFCFSVINLKKNKKKTSKSTLWWRWSSTSWKAASCESPPRWPCWKQRRERVVGHPGLAYSRVCVDLIKTFSNAHKEKVCRKMGLLQWGTIRVFCLSLGSPPGKRPTWGQDREWSLTQFAGTLKYKPLQLYILYLNISITWPVTLLQDASSLQNCRRVQTDRRRKCFETCTLGHAHQIFR